MQEHISKLFLYPVIIAVDEGIAKLINLLNGVFPKAFICLFGIPGAFHPKCVEHINGSSDGFEFLLSAMLFHIFVCLLVANMLFPQNGACAIRIADFCFCQHRL